MKKNAMASGLGIVTLLLTAPLLSTGCKTTPETTHSAGHKECGCGKPADKCECKEGCKHESGGCHMSH